MDLHLLDLAYEAAAIPELWGKALEQLCRISGAHAAALIALAPGVAPRYVATESYGPGFDTYIANAARYENVRPGRAMVKYPMGFAADVEVCSLAELERDAIYAELLRPAGFGWTGGTAIPVPSGDMLVFDLARRQDAGPFQREDMAAVDAYRPHLARAALLAHRLGLARAMAAADAMQAIGLPAATVSAGGVVTATNALFEALAPRVVSGAFGRLRLAEGNADRLLAAAIAGAATDLIPCVRAIPMPATFECPALVVHLVPMRRAAHDIFLRSAALLVVTPVSAPDAPLTEVLTGLFDLTPAEARVAGGVARGSSLDEIATRHGLSKETVRTQLKAVMAKTGTERQSELALLLAGARPLG